VSADVSIARPAAGQLRIVVREGWPGVATFVGLVAAVAAAVYALTPAARAQPGPLGVAVAAALLWAGIARNAREEYVVDRATRSLTTRHVWLFGTREEHVDGAGGRRRASGHQRTRRRPARGRAAAAGSHGAATAPPTRELAVGRRPVGGRGLLAEHLGVPVDGR
jgi:hypothetical protein